MAPSSKDQSLQETRGGSLRQLARRWLALNDEIEDHEGHLAALTTATATAMTGAWASASNTAAEVLIVAGDNPNRIHREAAWARLCGVAGAREQRQDLGVRLSRGGHRQVNR